MATVNQQFQKFNDSFVFTALLGLLLPKGLLGVLFLLLLAQFIGLVGSFGIECI